MAPKQALVAKTSKPVQDGKCCYVPNLDIDKSKSWTQEVLFPFFIGTQPMLLLALSFLLLLLRALVIFSFVNQSTKSWPLLIKSILIGYFDKDNRFFRNPPKKYSKL